MKKSALTAERREGVEGISKDALFFSFALQIYSAHTTVFDINTFRKNDNNPEHTSFLLYSNVF